MENNFEFIAGEYLIQNGNKTFIPNFINKPFKFNDERIFSLLEEASYNIGQLNELAKTSFITIFANMLIMKEAINSNLIENTGDEFSEFLMHEPSNDEHMLLVNNLAQIIGKLFSSKEKKELFSIKFLQEINKNIFQEAKKETISSSYGKIRTIQNFVGGTSLKDAMFIPPPPENIANLLSDLNDFWINKNLNIPLLIKVAISHYQFETIHPFRDGNGRIGRLLIYLQLKQEDKLLFPILGLSDFLYKHRAEYYNALMMVRVSNNLDHFVVFFLNAINEVTKKRTKTLRSIFKLRQECIDKINEKFRVPETYKKVLNILMLEKPSISVTEVEERLELTYQGANKLIKNLVNIGILQLEGSSKRNKKFIFKEYYDLILEQNEVSNDEQDIVIKINFPNLSKKKKIITKQTKKKISGKINETSR